MKESIVYTSTRDDIRHYGMTVEPDSNNTTAVLWVHGLYQSFYTEPALSIGRKIAEGGFLFVSGNNRGHDFGATLKREHAASIPGGGGWDKFEESVYDIDAWLDFILSKFVVDQIILLGHSFGTRKSVYYQSRNKNPLVKGLALLSTGTTYKEADPATYSLATEMVRSGRGKDLIPWPPEDCSMSAETYLERHAKQSLMRNLFTGSSNSPISRVAVPILAMTSGEENATQGKFDELGSISAQATSCPSFTRKLFEKADHYYTHFEEEVGHFITDWIHSIGY